MSVHPELCIFPTEANDWWFPGRYPWRKAALHGQPPLWKDPEGVSRANLDAVPPRHDRKIRAVFRLYQLLQGGHQFFTKSAMNLWMTDWIQQSFPGARFILLVRDGHSVALSYARKERGKIERDQEAFARIGITPDLDVLTKQCAEAWADHARESIRQETEGPLSGDRAMVLRYEDFCLSPRENLLSLARFMEISETPFEAVDLSGVDSTNFKARDSIDSAQWDALTDIMSEGLRHYGYLDASQSRIAGSNLAKASD